MVRLKVQEDNIKLKMNAPDGATFRTNEYTPIMSGSSDYNELDNKPSINGHTLEGDQSSEDLDLFSGDYDDLTNKPSINGNTLEGDKTNEELGIHIPEDLSELNNDEGYISSPNVVYCTCATARGTASKVAEIVSGKLTTLNTGDQAIVKFTNSNTSASPTLKIGNTDAKSIMRYGTTVPSASAETSWNAGSPILFVYDGTYWVMCGFLNSVYYEISVANITNGSSSSTGLTSGRRAKSAVEAFAPVKDVQVGGTSVVSGGIAEIPEIPELVTDLGVIDPEPYDDDVNVYLNTLTESGWYKFFWDSGDDYSYFAQVQAIEYGGAIYVNQHCWGLEESPITEFIRGFIVEDGEVILEDSTSYMTFATASNTFASKTHQHYRTDAKAVSVWDYCDGSQIRLQSDSPILYTDTLNNRQYLIDTWLSIRQPAYNYQKVTDLIDCSVFYQRCGYYQSGRTNWGDWYKFSGEIYTPPTGR